MRKAVGRLLEPVAAYDRIAPEFARFSDTRRLYLDRIDQLILDNIPQGARSLLDVGAGDGVRALRIGRAANLHRLVLLEPSAAMRSYWPCDVEAWAMRAEELSGMAGEFEVITCLWNVLGHIFPSATRTEVLRQFARLLSRRGIVFLDVNHRYNARHYGLLPTAFRFIRDRLAPSERNGDVVAMWQVAGNCCSTAGHVFTQSEFKRISAAAGLQIEKRIVVDYATGKSRRFSFNGNLLYLLRSLT